MITTATTPTIDINLDHATDALDSLDAELRQSIHLAFYSGFSTNQVANLLGVSVETAETRLSNGLVSLREALASAA
ncbi:sigma factor-like helix-turn-helix DNA-binding protein [Glaciihabitans tibetensis]|nr:sigma factor-like helix-turn-helix DNA-binding protein [Glaciihabitans tibetensis]